MDINSLSGVISTSASSGGASPPVAQAAVGALSGTVGDQSVATSSAAPKPPVAPTIEQVQQAVKDLNLSFRENNQGVQFAIDQTSKRVIVKVLDEKTHEVLRQIPSEELLALSQALDQKIGKLINQQA